MTGPFPDPSRRTSGLGPETSDDRSRANQRRLDDQRFAICIAVVFGVGDRRAQGLADKRSRFTRAQVDDSQCLGDALSLDQARNMTRLFRRDTHILGQSSHFHDWFPIVLYDCRPPGRLSDTRLFFSLPHVFLPEPEPLNLFAPVQLPVFAPGERFFPPFWKTVPKHWIRASSFCL